MENNDDQSQSESKRYYPQPAELNILTQNISRYFSFQERSIERSKVASEVSHSLQQYSQHWTHRAVRLWFNNNKNVIPTIQVNIENKPVLPSPSPLSDRKPSVRFQEPSYNMIPTPQTQPHLWIKEPIRINNNEMLSDITNLIETAACASQSNFPSVVQLYEEKVATILSNRISITIDKVKNSEFANFSAPRDHNFTYTNSSDREFVISRPPSADIHPLWQTRISNDKQIGYFDCTYVNDTVIAYINIHQPTNERVLNYSTDRINWMVFKLGILSKIDCFLLDIEQNTVWFMKGTDIYQIIMETPIKQFNCSISLSTNSYQYSESVRPTITLSSMVRHKDGIICSCSTPDLFYISSRMKIHPIRLNQFNNRKVFNVNKVNDNLVAAFEKTSVMKLFSEEGSEIRSFLGHIEPASFICPRNSNSFLTSSYDKSAKMWDIRNPVFVMSFSCDKKSITGVHCTEQYVFLGAHEKKMCAFDIRGSGPKPLLGIKTDDYTVVSPYYSVSDDTLSYFGTATKDGNSDSIIFVDENGQSSKYVFRHYSRFLSEQVLM